MRGEGFHQFLIVGADDRLLTDGLVNGSDFSINTEDRFPALNEFQQTLPRPIPMTQRDGIDKPFFTRNEADWEFRWAIHREPLELIAHVIETNQSYKKILTADYTMVNPISSIAYRSDVNFDSEFIDDKGYFDRHKLNTFKPGKNRGHIAWDDEFRFDYDRRVFDSFSGYQVGLTLECSAPMHGWPAILPPTPIETERGPVGLTITFWASILKSQLRELQIL